MLIEDEKSKVENKNRKKSHSRKKRNSEEQQTEEQRKKTLRRTDLRNKFIWKKLQSYWLEIKSTKEQNAREKRKQIFASIKRRACASVRERGCEFEKRKSFARKKKRTKSKVLLRHNGEFNGSDPISRLKPCIRQCKCTNPGGHSEYGQHHHRNGNELLQKSIEFIAGMFIVHHSIKFRYFSSPIFSVCTLYVLSVSFCCLTFPSLAPS